MRSKRCIKCNKFVIYLGDSTLCKDHYFKATKDNLSFAPVALRLKDLD